MIKYKKSLFVIGVLFSFLFCLYIIAKINNNIFEDVKYDKVSNNNLFAMMVETESGSGKYTQSTTNEWLTDGYIFNSTLSGCENGGELVWDNLNKKVVLKGNTSDKCYVYFDVYVKSLITDVCVSGQSLNSCITAMNGIDKNLYYHDSTLENGVGDNSYRYAGGDYALTDVGKSFGSTNVFSISATDDSGLIDLYCDDEKIYFGGYCESNMYYFLIKNDAIKYSSYKDVVKKAVEYGYVIGNQVKNYVCFGSDEEICPTDNLYRIIGVFDGKVKLIKEDYATSRLLGTDGDYDSVFSSSIYNGNYKGNLTVSNIVEFSWNYNGLPDHTGDNQYGSNDWSTSLLNNTNLNTNYLNNIGSKWANMLAITTWTLGGNTETRIINTIPKYTYQWELVVPAISNKTYTSKVSLMYISDLLFASGPEAWTIKLSSPSSSSAKIKDNWMYMGLNEWTMSYESSASDNLFRISFLGRPFSASAIMGNCVRPVAFLDSAVKYISGIGSDDDPIRINI